MDISESGAKIERKKEIYMRLHTILAVVHAVQLKRTTYIYHTSRMYRNGRFRYVGSFALVVHSPLISCDSGL